MFMMKRISVCWLTILLILLNCGCQQTHSNDIHDFEYLKSDVNTQTSEKMKIQDKKVIYPKTLLKLTRKLLGKRLQKMALTWNY